MHRYHDNMKPVFRQISTKNQLHCSKKLSNDIDRARSQFSPSFDRLKKYCIATKLGGFEISGFLSNSMLFLHRDGLENKSENLKKLPKTKIDIPRQSGQKNRYLRDWAH